MADKDVLQIKNIVDVTDQLKQRKLMGELLKTIRTSISRFEDAFRVRRQRLLEINAIYRNQSYMDKNKAPWQTQIFLPLPYNAIENKTSVIHQALWGNRLSSPFSAIGRTAEDHDYALSAEGYLNNTMDRIGFYGVSEEGIRSCVKYGLGVYRYGWTRRSEDVLWRDVERDKDGKIKRNEKGSPTYKFVRKQHKVNQPYVRAVDIVDHIGWDPSAKAFEKWGCSFTYEIDEETPESVFEKETRGLYLKGSYDKLSQTDPHGLSAILSDVKTEEIKKQDGLVNDIFATPLKTTYPVVHWYGWFDIDGDGLREFIKAVVILENSQILSAEENLLGEYPFVDIQFSRSLHSLTPWGVVDPVVELVYYINDFLNQRGDSVKLKINPQFLINVDAIMEDHAYISMPGAFHPVMTGDKPASNALSPIQYQNVEYLSVNEEERLINMFRESTGNVNIQQAISSLDRTPATTLISLLNEQQAGNSMIVNGILERHGTLGSRVLRMLQLFGDEQFVYRTIGKRGLEFRNESLENVLGEYDIKVTTSTFFGNKQMELQQLIQLKPLWANSPHIDQVEVDRAILENALPKKVDKILKVPTEPLSIIDEQVLFLAGQGESVKLSDQEDMASLQQKLRAHQAFQRSEKYDILDGQDKLEFSTHLDRIANRVQELQLQQAMQAQQAAKGLPGQMQLPGITPGPQGNLGNLGLPGVREGANLMRPRTNNIEL